MEFNDFSKNYLYRYNLFLSDDENAAAAAEAQHRMAELLARRAAFCEAGEARWFGDLTVLLSSVGAAFYDSVAKKR